MEIAYIQAENLKHKRTFTKTLIVLAPFVTALMNFFAPLWFQLNSYNWWYILLYPGFLTLTCALIEQRDMGKTPDNIGNNGFTKIFMKFMVQKRPKPLQYR